MKLYRPSNGSEGTWFESNWCDNCIKHPKSADAKNQCVVLGNEFHGNATGKWVYKNNVPTCTAFKSRSEFNKNRKRYKKEDKNQMELF